MATATPDFSTMTAAQIKEFIESQPQPEAPAPVEEVEEGVIDPETGEPFEQPRDPATGRFVSADPVATSEEFEETIEKEIDLGDGSGVQIFRGVGTGATQEEALIAAHEALNDELVKAQRNATIKIRELSQRKPDPEPPVFNPEEEQNLSQRLIREPSKVLQEVADNAAKKAREEMQAEQERKAKQAADAHNAAVAFLQSTPEYFACPENQDRIGRYMDIYQLPHTVEGIRTAYEAVKDLLKQKPAAPTRPAPRSSGLSTRSSAAPPVAPTGMDEKSFAAWCEQNGVPVPKPIRRKF